ncbi:MAG: hypothetical protein KAJ42_14370 [Gemmatimonadetes bacterium]|nr:hypothetical protein [Gemmatimonadota bacterium]
MRYDWPQDLQLEASQRTILEGIGERMPLLAEWTEGEKFIDADAPAAMAGVLIPKFHPELTNVSVKYLFQENMGSTLRTVWGKAAKSPARWLYLTSIDFVLTFNWTIWKTLTAPQQAALVDHELEHCFVEETAEGTKLVLHPHDLEEFNTTVRRWGLWRSNVANFIDAARPQMELALGAATAPAQE